MYGFFMFGQPMFADSVRIATAGGGSGPGGERQDHIKRRHFESVIEAQLIAFLNVIE